MAIMAKLCIMVPRIFLRDQAAVEKRQPGPVIIRTRAEHINIQALSPEDWAFRTACCSAAI